MGVSAFGTTGGSTRESCAKLQNFRPSLISMILPLLTGAAAVRGSGAPILIQVSSVLISLSERRFLGGICKS